MTKRTNKKKVNKHNITLIDRKKLLFTIINVISNEMFENLENVIIVADNNHRN